MPYIDICNARSGWSCESKQSLPFGNGWCISREEQGGSLSIDVTYIVFLEGTGLSYL